MIGIIRMLINRRCKKRYMTWIRFRCSSKAVIHWFIVFHFLWGSMSGIPHHAKDT